MSTPLPLNQVRIFSLKLLNKHVAYSFETDHTVAFERLRGSVPRLLPHFKHLSCIQHSHTNSNKDCTNDQMTQMQIKKIHLFCDIRVHEQLKRMTSIQNEIDGFQNCCEEVLKTTSSLVSPVAEETLEALRGDRFLQTTMKLQSELIGRALLEVGNTA